MADPKLAYTLCRCVEAGFTESVIQAVERYDPFVRGSLKRRVRALLDDAAKLTTIPADGEGETHHLRLALLSATGRLAGIDPNDTSAVSAVADAVRAQHPINKRKPFWPFTASMFGAIALALAATIAVVFWPNAEERFRRSPFGEALADPLTDFAIAASRGKGAASKARAQLLAPAVKRQIGDDAAGLLEQVLTLTEQIESAELGDGTKAAIEQLESVAKNLDGHLESRGMPAHLDTYVVERGDTGGGSVWLLSYYVEERAHVRFGNQEAKRVLWGKRLDNLSHREWALVYPSRAADGVILSLDEVQEELLADIDVLAKNRPFRLLDDKADAPVAMRAGQLVREELLAASRLSDAEGDDMAQLVAKRRAAVERMTAKGWHIPHTLVFRPRDEMRMRTVDDVDAKEAMRINDKLKDYRRQFARIVDAFASAEEEREIAFVAPPPEKKLVVGGEDITALVASRLGVLARGRSLPMTTLARIARGSQQWSRRQRYAALVLVHAIGVELGIAPATAGEDDAVRAALEVDEGFLTELFKRSNADITGAAARAYKKLFGEDAPAYARTKIGK